MSKFVSLSLSPVHQQSPHPFSKPITNHKPQHTTTVEIKLTTSTTTKSYQPKKPQRKKKKKKTHEVKQRHCGGYSTFKTYNQSQTTTHNHCKNQINHLYHNKIKSTHNLTTNWHSFDEGQAWQHRSTTTEIVKDRSRRSNLGDWSWRSAKIEFGRSTKIGVGKSEIRD